MGRAVVVAVTFASGFVAGLFAPSLVFLAVLARHTHGAFPYAV